MAEIKHFKVVASLPSPLEPDSVYYVRVGMGYDQYVTNGVGVVVAYEANSKLSLESKVDKESGKQLSDENYTLDEKIKLASLENFDDSTIQAELDTKVDKIVGKGLSTEDFTTPLKNKLDGVAAGAQVNVATNLAQGSRTTTTVAVTSSTGTSATLAAATTTQAGLMSSADKVKLNGVATGATVNQTDAHLLDRANHTGTQDATTITGLSTVATSGQASDVSLVDAGDYYTSTNVEGALQEVGSMLGDVGSALDGINGEVV